MRRRRTLALQLLAGVVLVLVGAMLLLAVSSTCRFRQLKLQVRIFFSQSYLYSDHPMMAEPDDRQPLFLPDAGGPAPEVIKRVLWWTGLLFGKWEPHSSFGRKPFLDAGCAVNNCEVVKERDLIRSSDAVIFHWPDTFPDDLPLPEDLPLGRPVDQVWILFNTEPPEHFSFDMTFLNGKINWTWTYRYDSDFPSPYGGIRPRTSDSQPPILKQQQQQNKTQVLGLVSWLASNCHTSWGRERYVAELSKHIDVHTYGGCGTRNCPSGGEGEHLDHCKTLVYTRYKFYLSFENCVCRDYVTEKLYQLLQVGAAVPVVFGGADYEQVAPPGSFVDASRFSSPRHLAEYLKAVAANDTLYAEFGRWRQHVAADGWHESFLCRLCKRLNDPALSWRRQVYDDLHSWWYEDAKCRREFDIWGES